MNYFEALRIVSDRLENTEYFISVEHCNEHMLNAVARRLPTILGMTIRDYLMFATSGSDQEYLTRNNVEGVVHAVTTFGQFEDSAVMRAIPWPIAPERVTGTSEDKALYHYIAATEFDSRTKGAYKGAAFPDAIGSYVVSLADKTTVLLIESGCTLPKAHQEALHEADAQLPCIDVWLASPQRAEDSHKRVAKINQGS